jgi:hypothetical protein
MVKKKDIGGLNRCLAASDTRDRASAAFSLSLIALKYDLSDSSSIPPLNHMLKDTDIRILINATRAIRLIAETGVGDASSVPLLNNNAGNPNPDIRKNVVYALCNLAELGIGDSSSVPVLNEMLGDYEQEIVNNAAFAIGSLADKLGIGAESSFPPLNKLLKKPDADIRANSASAILSLAEKMGLAHEASPPLLEVLLTDEDQGVRKNAEDALKRIELVLGEGHKSFGATTQPGFESLGIRQIASQPPILAGHDEPRIDEETSKFLSKAVSLNVPEFMDSNTMSEILVVLNNTSTTTLTDLSLDTSQLEEDFEVTGTVAVKTLSPGKALEQRIKIKPRYEKGTFPVKIIIMAKGARVTREYSIKVGGTEIY